MKKLIFSAIALLAFSGVSIANTIADDSKDDKTDVAKTKTVAGVSCTRRVTTDCGGGNSVTVSYTATVQSTGDYEVDKGKACEAASKKANTLSAAGC